MKCLYVDLNCLDKFSLTTIGYLTYSNIKKYIDRHNLNMVVVFDDFGNMYIEENVDDFKKCAEFRKVAILLKGGRYEKT